MCGTPCLRKDETTKLAPACATQPLSSRPIQQNVLLSQGQDANDHAGRAGLDGETNAKWSLSEDYVSAAEWQLCVLLVTRDGSIWWRVARPNRRTISLVRLARLVEGRYSTRAGAVIIVFSIVCIPAIVKSCIEAKILLEAHLVCSSVVRP
jgi:hypothetical protein